MYEEIVKALRNCDFPYDVHYCRKCVCQLEHGGSCDCRRLFPRAADAIEELIPFKEQVEKGMGLLDKADELLKAIKPRWISVKERLPEEYKDVLCYYEYFRYGDYNCMFRTIDRGYYGDGRWGGEAGQGHKNKVLAWMPLPDPPKEKTE